MLVQIPMFRFLWLITLFRCCRGSAGNVLPPESCFMSLHPSKFNLLFYKTLNYFLPKGSGRESWACAVTGSNWLRFPTGVMADTTGGGTIFCPNIQAVEQAKASLKPNFVFVIYFCLVRKFTTKHMIKSLIIGACYRAKLCHKISI